MATKRARVTPTQVVRLQEMVWDGQAGGATSDMPTIHEVHVWIGQKPIVYRVRLTPGEDSTSLSVYYQRTVSTIKDLDDC